MSNEVPSSGTTYARQLPTLQERVFVVAVVVYSTGGFFPLLQGERDWYSGAPTGTPITNALWVSIYLISLLLLIRHRRNSLERARRNWPLLSLITFPAISTLWSAAPFITLLNTAALFGTALVAVYLADRFSTGDVLNLGLWGLGIAGICSVVMAVFVPRYGMGSDGFEGSWLGIYGQKNSLGAAMAAGFLIALLLLRFKRPIRVCYLLALGSMLLLVYLSGSVTSLIVCLASPVVMWISQIFVVRSPRLLWRRVGIVLFAAILILTLIFHFEQVTNAFGRDEGLTGRTVIWLTAMDAIRDRPVLGYGYGAFWRGAEGPSGEFWRVFGQAVGSAHNGFLQIWLDLGLVGLIVAGVSMTVVARSIWGRMRRSFCLETVWPWMFVCFLFLSNLTEATFMKANMLPTILCLAIIRSVLRRDINDSAAREFQEEGGSRLRAN